MIAPRFSRFACYLYIEKVIEEYKKMSPEKAILIVPVLVRLQREIERWNGARPFRLKGKALSLAISERSRLDDGLMNFGFRRLPIADLPTVKQGIK